jgi:hypothetical protein
MSESLDFYKKIVTIIVLGFCSSTMQSQDTPIGNKIVGNGDPVNYYIGHFPVPGSDGLDLHWYGGIRFGDRTGNSIMQVINGNVGIGTTNPLQKFVVSNGSTEGLEVYLGQPTGTVGLQVYNRSTSQYNKMAFAASQFTFNFGNFGIGTDNPRANLDMAKDISNGQLGTVFGRLPEGDGSGLGTYLGVKGYTTQGADAYNIKSFSIVHDFYGQTNSSINFYRGGGILGGFMTFSTSDNTEKMRIATNGNVGIGTTAPDSKLTVNGKIHAQEVKIDLLSPMTVPDYVFSSDYKLKTLQEVEEYINKNSHLPEIPSAKEIEKNGLMLAEMNMNLLKKVEELTLYVIEQEKKNAKQSDEIVTLKKENESFKILSERLSKIESQLKTAK